MFQFCWSHDGWLVEIKSEEKEHLVEEVIVPEIAYWIGLTDFAQEGDFVWAKSYEKTNYTDWYGQEPSRGRYEDCVFKSKLEGKEGWFDYNCDSTAVESWGINIHALCEADNTFLESNIRGLNQDHISDLI